MVAAQDVLRLFNDAKSLHESALKVAEEGDLRDAAEKAWGAVNRATAALVLARTDQLPVRSPEVTHGLVDLADADCQLFDLRRSYFVFQGLLHGTYFYDGRLGPPAKVISEIRGVGDYILEAERWANG